MMSSKYLIVILSLVLFSSTVVPALAQAAPTKRCSKPKWKRAIAPAVSHYLSTTFSGASQPLLAKKCWRSCQVDTRCMAYEWTATGKKEGQCELFTTGPMVRGKRRHAAGICKLLDGSGDAPTNGTIERRCPPTMIWNPKRRKCQPRELAPNDDSTDGNTNPQPNGCPEGWVYSPETGKCSPGDILPPDDDSTDGNTNPQPNGCPEGWVYSPETGKCSPGDILPQDDQNNAMTWVCSDFDDILSPENREECERHTGCVFVAESVTWGRCVPRQEN